MVITIPPKYVLALLHVLSWIIFTGLCIQAGAFFTNSAFAVAKPSVVPLLYQQGDMSDLLAYDAGYYAVITLIAGIAATGKAVMFYLIIIALIEKKFTLAQPFNQATRRFVLRICYLTLAIGFFSVWGEKLAGWLADQGVKMPDIQQLHLDGADVWVFMAIVLLAIAQILRRGMEIQAENDLTI